MKPLIAVIWKASLIAFLILSGQNAIAHDGEDEDSAESLLILGVLDFPNSGSEAAQEAFERGVKLLHSFEFDDARTAFIEAQEIDPRFVMAIWGEAMTLNHPLWGEQDRALLTGNLEGLEEYIEDLTVKRIPDGSHWVSHEQPELVNSLIRDFLL